MTLADQTTGQSPPQRVEVAPDYDTTAVIMDFKSKLILEHAQTAVYILF